MVCGARALDFLCAANDAIYESPYSAKCRAERAVRAVQGLQLSALAALAKPSSSLQVCLPPLPEEALDRLREYWNCMALSCGAASLRNREIGAASGHRAGAEPGSFGVAKRINRIGRDLPALFERRAAR